MPTRTAPSEIERLTAAWEPRIRDAFLEAFAAAVTHVDIVALTALIQAGNIEGALAAVGVSTADFSALALTQTSAFNDAGMALARTASRATFQVLFDVRNPRAEQWIRQRSSTLIQEITDDQRTTIRNALEAGMQAGENPRTTALNLVGRIDPRTKQRTGGVIGLHSTQEAWLRSYSADLASEDPTRLRALLQRGLRDKRFDASVLKAIRDGTAIPAEIQAKMRAAYAHRALKWRADNIARTETIRSLGQAQTEMWQQQIDRGKVDVDLMVRRWVTAGDERVRHTHRLIPGMNKDGRKWNEPFDTPTGPQMHAPSQTDIGCRCYEKVTVDYLAQALRKKKEREVGNG
jgi:hypothetical protein